MKKGVGFIFTLVWVSVSIIVPAHSQEDMVRINKDAYLRAD